MSWWQKKLLGYGLRYGLNKTGLLEENALNVDNLDITIGKKNVIELKDVGLNLTRITKLAQLPPCLRLETARILLLRLTIPADFYHSSIVVEVDGVDILAQLEEQPAQKEQGRKARPRSPQTARAPQHRKVNRRIPSPPPYDPGGLSDEEEDVHIPTTHEVAKSFLKEEPTKEIQELEAVVAANAKSVEESFVSESSESSDVGTGMGIGVPGFLAGFLQGIVDRFKLEIRNVQVKVQTEVQGEGDPIPVTLRLKVGNAALERLEDTAEDGQQSTDSSRRIVDLQDIGIDILSDGSFLADLSDLQSHGSKAATESPTTSRVSYRDGSNLSHTSERNPSLATEQSNSPANSRTLIDMPPTLPPHIPSSMQNSTAGLDADRFADARGGQSVGDLGSRQDQSSSELDIRPGDDNISWGSRRSNASAPADDLWRSMVSEEDLPQSVVIQPERVGTPRAFSSRGSSPYAQRRRRAVSPYERTLQSPGSWPRLDESPERHRALQSPGSWPALDQSQQSVHEPLAQVISSNSQEITDNKRDALEHSASNLLLSRTPPDRQETPGDDMLESRVFSHEEAQSMYMSAMSGSPEIAMPGGWGSDMKSERAASPVEPRKPAAGGPSGLDGSMMSTTSPHSPMLSGNVTPRAKTPSPVNASPPDVEAKSQTMASRQVFFVDRLSVAIPAHGQEETLHQPEPVPNTQLGRTADRNAARMPGTFSAYSEMSSSRWRGTESIRSEARSILFAPREDATNTAGDCTDIVVGAVAAQLDVSTTRLLYALALKVSAAMEPHGHKATPESPDLNDPKSNSTISIELEQIQLSFSERLEDAPALRGAVRDRHGMVDICARHVLLKHSEASTLHVGAFKVLLGGQNLLSFGDDSTFDPSTEPPEKSVVALSMATRFDINKRPITDLLVQSALLQLTIDLNLIDDVCNSWGGLSGVMELGNSMLSESASSSPVSSKSPPKGVRFAGEEKATGTTAETKMNSRIDGVAIRLRGQQCSVLAKTGVVKAQYREQGFRSTIESALLTGPFIDSHPSAPASVDLVGLRIEYLPKPHDEDLERLLSLLTPSKDKFDNDDDILVDTLLRQRRKGALLRTMVDDVKVRVDEWTWLATLQTLEGDLNKLSAVTKYLPEDERPGVLTLVRLKAAEAQFPVDERFGKLKVGIKDLHLAHVGVPPLLAFSIGLVNVSQVRGPVLVHAFVPLTGADHLPLIMGRMLGDDAIKLKLYNVAVEYSVPVILDLTSIDEEQEPAEMAAHLAESVANLVLNETMQKRDTRTKTPAKRMEIDILVHDSAIGLTPHKLESKAILVVSDAQLSTKLPPENSIAARLELRQASLWVAEHAMPEAAMSESVVRVAAGRASNIDDALAQQDYVSVGTIRAGKIAFEAKDDEDEEVPKTVEADVSIDLLLLETCADSTQTLFAVLGALAPPTPPSREPKYLTEPMPVEDLMKSFSGEAFPVQREETQPPSVLYDVENASGDDDFGSPSLSGLGASALEDEPDDLLFQSEMAGSLYGPVGSTLGMGIDNEDESTLGDDYPETAESLLEEDPFEMADAPVARMGDAALMRDLGRQCKPAVSEEVVDLGLWEIEHLGFDALNGQQALGDRNRFNAPHVGGRSQKAKTQPKVPFKLRLHDSNVIWHLHDGYDWQRTRDGIADVVEQVEQRAEERRARRRQSRNEPEDDESIIGDVLFNSIYIGIPSNNDAEDLRRRINHTINEDVSETASVPASAISRPTTAFSGSVQPSRQRHRRRLKLGRSKSHKMSFELKGVAVDLVVLPPGGEVVSSIDIRLRDFEIYDKVPSSTWRKFLTHRDDPTMREMCKPMFHIQMDNVRTIRSHAATDIMLHVTALPIRLHVDQDAQQFMIRFFAFKDESTPASTKSDQDKPYISRIEVDDVYLRLDYKPKNLDWMGLRAGKTSELMNVLTLEGANIKLQHAIVHGIGGFDQLHPKLDALWTPDVIQNQLPQVVSGVAALRSLVNLGVGMRDVVAIPIKEYKKDGRVMRSIQKGAYHFGKTTTSELARLGAKVALGTQTLLSNAEELLAPAETSRDMDEADESEKPAVSAYASQPIGVMSGLRSARKYLEHDLLTARDALIAVQGEFMESRTPGGAAAAVARHAPTVILRPVIGATRAAGTALLGVGNAVDRGNLRRVEDKYKPR